MASPETVLRAYFHAKDENRPHLLEGVFSPDATLEVDNRSAAIAFPALTVGREEMAQVLVRRFGRIHDNVYSFYMARPPAAAAAFGCDWLVGMTEKESDKVCVGCGHYDWAFEAAAPHRARYLKITIEAMQVLPASAWAPVRAWLGGLDYPWSSAAAVRAAAPAIESLAPVLEYLGRGRA